MQRCGYLGGDGTRSSDTYQAIHKCTFNEYRRGWKPLFKITSTVFDGSEDHACEKGSDSLILCLHEENSAAFGREVFIILRSSEKNTFDIWK